MRSLIGDNPKQWGLTLPQAEFAYNRSIKRTTCKSPFKVVYGRNPITPLDLACITIVDHLSVEGDERSTQIKELHQQVRMQIEKHNRQYADRANKHRKRVVYREGDLVWIHLRQERFPNVSATFNVADLSPFLLDSDEEAHSRSSPFQEEEDDANRTSDDKQRPPRDVIHNA